MADTTPKEVEITLTRQYITNGKVLAGKVRVPFDVADDLKRREHEQDVYQKNLYQNNKQNVEVKEIAVGS